jgi:hypothetical protein
VSPDRPAIDRAIEGHDRADSARLRLGDEVCLGEVEPIELVHRERPQQQLGSAIAARSSVATSRRATS